MMEDNFKGNENNCEYLHGQYRQRVANARQLSDRMSHMGITYKYSCKYGKVPAMYIKFELMPFKGLTLLRLEIICEAWGGHPRESCFTGDGATR